MLESKHNMKYRQISAH